MLHLFMSGAGEDEGIQEIIERYGKGEQLQGDEKEAIAKILAPYVSDPFGDVFVVQNLPGIVGGAYARYSRAPNGFRQTLLREFLKEGILDHKRAGELLERVLIAYGDDSVGELEGTHLSFENVSNLATKVIEDCRIGGSPIEQSTRYVFYDQKDNDGNWRYYRDPRIMASPLAEEFASTMDLCYQTYHDLVEPMQEYFKKLKPIEEAQYDIREKGNFEALAGMEDEKDKKAFRITYNSDIRTKTCDTIRCILPAATTTHVGIFGIGRFFQGLLTKMYSHPLAEMQELAKSAHRELNKAIPAYVKRAKPNPYAIENESRMRVYAEKLLQSHASWESSSDTALLENPRGPEEFADFLLAELLFPYAAHPTRQLRYIIKEFAPQKKQELIALAVGERKTRRDRVSRQFEFGYPLTFDLVGNFGIYRDLQRHRMLTQYRQALTPHLGFAMPDEIIEAGYKDRIERCVEKSTMLYKRLRDEGLAHEAEYAVLFGFNLRWRMGMNFREAQHLLELRTTKQGHPSYRQLCQQMAEKITLNYPLLKGVLSCVDYNDYFWSRAESEAGQRRKERRLVE